jgi:hypothetical protein
MNKNAHKAKLSMHFLDGGIKGVSAAQFVVSNKPHNSQLSPIIGPFVVPSSYSRINSRGADIQTDYQLKRAAPKQRGNRSRGSHRAVTPNCNTPSTTMYLLLR